MQVTIIKTNSTLKAGEKINEMYPGKKQCFVYSITDLTHRSQHLSSDIYIIDNIRTPEAIKMILTIDMWMPSFQKDIVVITKDDLDAFESLHSKIKNRQLFIL